MIMLNRNPAAYWRLDRCLNMTLTPPSKNTVCAVVFACACIFLLWGLTSYLVDVWRAQRAVTWPTADGVVVSSKAVRGCGKGSSYYPVVRYEYKIGGVGYVGHRDAFGSAGCGSESAAEVVAS